MIYSRINRKSYKKTCYTFYFYPYYYYLFNTICNSPGSLILVYLNIPYRVTSLGPDL